MWRPRGSCHSDIAASAADILDEELLTESLGQPLHDDTPDNVRRTARREWHDNFDRMIGVIRRSEAWRRCDGESDQQKRNSKTIPYLIPAHSIIWRRGASILLGET